MILFVHTCLLGIWISFPSKVLSTTWFMSISWTVPPIPSISTDSPSTTKWFNMIRNPHIKFPKGSCTAKAIITPPIPNPAKKALRLVNITEIIINPANIYIAVFIKVISDFL